MPKRVSQLPYEENTKRLMKRLATDVQIKTTARGRGQIVIKFKSDQDFQRIQQLLEGAS